MKKMNCCFCDYAGLSEKGVRVHMARVHPAILSMMKVVKPGRPPGNACNLCGMVHSEVSRPGWANRRRKLERPRAALYHGSIPPGEKDVLISKAVVPEGVTRLKGVILWADQPGHITLNIKDPDTGHVRKYTFRVGPGALTA